MNWIKVEDRLPEDWESVFLYTRYETKDYAAKVAHLDCDGNFINLESGEIINNVTHWVEITPPKD